MSYFHVAPSHYVDHLLENGLDYDCPQRGRLDDEEPGIPVYKNVDDARDGLENDFVEAFPNCSKFAILEIMSDEKVSLNQEYGVFFLQGSIDADDISLVTSISV